MNGVPAHHDEGESALTILREALMREDTSLRQVGPILSHLLTVSDRALFNDRVLATVRGMASDLAGQVLAFEAGIRGQTASKYVRQHEGQTTAMLLRHDAFVRFAHMLALETQFLDRVEREAGLDPAMPPLTEALATASDSTLSEQARQLIAAQMRFLKQARPMSLPMGELPAELLHDILALWRSSASERGIEITDRQMQDIIKPFDEAKSRLSLLDRMLFELNGASNTPVKLGQGGGSLFLSDVANRTGSSRADVALATTEDQYARLVLLLKAGGYPRAAIEEQLLIIHPGLKVSRDLIEIAVHEAQLLLRSSGFAHGAAS